MQDGGIFDNGLPTQDFHSMQRECKEWKCNLCKELGHVFCIFLRSFIYRVKRKQGGESTEWESGQGAGDGKGGISQMMEEEADKTGENRLK